MIDLTHKAALQFWYDYKDTAVYRVILFMETMTEKIAKSLTGYFLVRLWLYLTTHQSSIAIPVKGMLSLKSQRWSSDAIWIHYH